MGMSEDILGRTLEGLGKSFGDLSGELVGAFNKIVAHRHSIFKARQAYEYAQAAKDLRTDSQEISKEMSEQLDEFDMLADMMRVQLIPKYELVCRFLELDPEALDNDIDQACYYIALEKNSFRLG